MNDVAAALACFAITLVAIAALRPLAVKVDLVDRPGGRKTHHGEVPIIGGLGMFLGIVLGLGMLQQPVTPSGPLLAAISLMVVLGMVDDRFGLSPWARLPVQLTAAAIAAYGTDTFITTLGNPFGSGVIILNGAASQTLTLFMMVAAINAFNMLDGMDGLAGMAAAIGFAALGYMAAAVGLQNSPRISMIVIAAILAFLIFNAPLLSNNPIRCFMGDAGSTFLGLSLAWVCLRVTQSAGDRSISPVTALWLIALPLYELVWTFTRRILRGQSPFRADAEHFHHLIVRGGFSVRAAFLLFSLLATLLAGTGIVLERVGTTDRTSFLLLLAIGFGVVTSMYRMSFLARLVPHGLQRKASIPSPDMAPSTSTKP